MLKKRFPILQTTTDPTFGITTQKKIILACCILHNYLMGLDPDQNLIDEVHRELTNQRGFEQGHQARREDNNDTARGEQIRDNIAASMWLNY